MNRKMKYILMLCLSLVLIVGSAMADTDNNSTQDTPAADTPSNNSVNGTENMDDAAAGGNDTGNASEGNSTDDAAGGNDTDDAAGGNDTDDAAGGNGTDDAAGGNGTDDAADGNGTDDAAGGNGTDDTADDNVTDDLTDEIFSDGDEADEGTDDIPPYEGAIGPEHALYGLKIAFGNINETFTYNSSERLGLQVSRARHRIAEARREMKIGNDNATGIALGHYKHMMDAIGVNVNGSDVNDTELVKARDKMSKHQMALQYMIQQKSGKGKNMEGLTDALNNSLILQEKFSNKLEKKLQKGGNGGSMKNQFDNASNKSMDKSKGGKPYTQRANQKGSNSRNTR